MPRKFLVIDAETDPFQKDRIPKPFIWGVYDGETFSTYKTFEEIYERYQREKVIFYAHNGGKFDYHFILDYINPFEPIMVINGRIAKMRVGACEFRDSYNLFPMPLSAYKKDEIDYSIMEESERDKPENRKRIFSYLRGDCIYLYDLLESFFDSYGISLTLASAALRQWRKISGEKNPHTTKDFYGQIAPFYYGGRVQAFALGEIKEEFKVYDINSAYPYAMLSDHPYGTSFTISDRLPSKDRHLAFIKLRCRSMGQFPFRSENGLYFPNDGLDREFNVSGYEYQTASDLGLLEECSIIEVFTFPERINFKQYVNHFFKLKQSAEKTGDKLKRNESKLFLNGLYGKFSCNPSEYREFMAINPSFIEASTVDGWSYNSDFGKYALVYRPLPEEKQNYLNVATGASITGFQRAQMMRANHAIDKPIYCDTDSFAFCGNHSLDVGDGIGQWKHEATCDYGAIAGKKLYAFRKSDGTFKLASKGVNITASEIIKLARGGTVKYESIAPTFSVRKKPSFLERNLIMKKDLQFIN